VNGEKRLMKLEQDILNLTLRLEKVERYLNKQRDADEVMKQCTPRILEALQSKGFWRIEDECINSE
jgi:hypothetical protein